MPEAIHQPTRAEYDAIDAYNYSQIRAFDRCQAAWFHEYVTKDYRRETTPAMLIGKLFESVVCHDTKALAELENEPDLFKTVKGSREPRAATQHAMTAMAGAWNAQPALTALLEGHHQVCLTGTIGGLPVKALLDVFNPELRRVVDIKTVANFDGSWTVNEEGRNVKVAWWETWNYTLQAVVYSMLVNQNYGWWPEYHIAACSKEATPDVEWIRFDSSSWRWQQEWQRLPVVLADMEAVRKARNPLRCSRRDCDYCRATKKLTEPLEV